MTGLTRGHGGAGANALVPTKPGPGRASGPEQGLVPEAAPALPPMPPALAEHVQDLLAPHPDTMGVSVPSDHVRALARAHRAALRRYLVPARREVIAAWFWPISDAVEWQAAEDEFERRLMALNWVADGVPWIGWTRETQREAMLTFRRLPSVSAVMELVRRPCAALLDLDRALAVLADDGPTSTG